MRDRQVWLLGICNILQALFLGWLLRQVNLLWEAVENLTASAEQTSVLIGKQGDIIRKIIAKCLQMMAN